jgi:hypothetical protein
VDAGAGHPATNGGTSTVAVCDAGGAATGRCLQWSYNAAVLTGDKAILIRPTVSDPEPVPGRMHGNGFLDRDGKRYRFDFRVAERASGDERGAFDLRVRSPGRGRDDRFRSQSVTSVTFSDDPAIRPGRAAHPQIDTVLFNGLGEWNGAAGYTFEVSARDEGEPGRHRESIRLSITSPTGTVVAHASGEIDGGNIQSLRIAH